MVWHPCLDALPFAWNCCFFNEEEMKIIYNNIIPFKGFSAMNLFGVLFVRNGVRLSEKLLNHERIHTAQMKEMLYLGFYLWYFVEWLVRLFGKGNAYRSISFEQEAYDNDDNLTYQDNRKPFEWLKYVFG